MFAKVIPALKLPRELRAFDYAIPDEYRDVVRRGSWVVVPWRNKPTDGLVIDVSEESEIPEKRVKEILGLGATTPLPEDLTALPEWMTERYFVAPGTALRAFLPRTPKTKVITEVGQWDRRTVGQKDSGTPLRQGFGEQAEGRSVLVRYSNPREKIEETIRLTEETLDKQRSVIIITPHVGEVDLLSKTLSGHLPKAEIIKITGKTSPASMRKIWHKTLEDQPVLIVGSRPAIFTPVFNPGLFIILESDSADLRQYDQNPRYDAREVAMMRSEVSGADIALMSHAHRLEDHVAGIPVKQLPSAPSDQVSLLDISGNPLGRDNPLSPVAVDRVRESLQAGKKVLIFLNRKGSAGAMVCGDCGKVLRCSKCGIAESFDGKSVLCRRCRTTRPTPGSCHECGGLSLRPVGMGTVSVTQALNQEFPEARLARHDAESMSGGGSKLEPDADIYVGTRLLLHDASENPENMTDWGCVIALDTDGLLSHPGFRVMEDAWRTVCVMRDIAASSGAPLLLQTLDPENPKIRRLLDDSERFMEDEREARKKASYPPVGNLITITVKDGEEPAAERAAVQLSEAAREVLKDAAVSVTGALKPKQPFRDGKWRRVVAIKTSADIPESVIAFLNSLSEEYIIDRNPETI